jgi:hypothetical protein
VDGRFQGGYADVFEVICPSCGDHPTWITPRPRSGFNGSAGRARYRRPWPCITSTSDSPPASTGPESSGPGTRQPGI